ncbi:MAG: class I SAM-dependent methyltransferase [Nitrococcus sp.]|nr:class I SAM-dependent methyltransferase [Nitrococcus sp.]
MAYKPCAPACERNRDPILAVLQRHFADRNRVLEIGSGTGQHAVYFGAALPHLIWQTSDLEAHHAGIRAWLDEASLANVLPPLRLDVTADWPAARYDAVFSANTLHIMGWSEVQALFAALPGVLLPKAKVVVYGPFHYHGRPTSDSNARFDAALRSQPGDMGIRDRDSVDRLAQAGGLNLIDDRAMPANNRCLVWQRTAAFAIGGQI